MTHPTIFFVTNSKYLTTTRRENVRAGSARQQKGLIETKIVVGEWANPFPSLSASLETEHTMHGVDFFG